MTRQFAALSAALTLLAAPALAAPAPTPTSAVSGAWVERDVHYRFEIRPGGNPDQLTVTLPADVKFPGGHTFVLARTGPARFSSKDETNRPKIVVSFTSSARGELKLAGAGPNWIAIEDFTLVRP